MSGVAPDPLDRIAEWMRTERTGAYRLSPLQRDDIDALVEVARAARAAWDADQRTAGAWTATGEQAVRDLAAAIDDIGAALARLDKDTT